MLNRILFYFSAFSMAAILLLARNAAAQPGCPDSAKYLVRDEAGKVMSLEELEKIAVSINGVPLKLRRDIVNNEPAYYEYEFVHYFDQKIIRDTGKIPFANPLSISISPHNICGKAGDLTLTYRGKQMRLIFDIEQAPFHAIDSLPFQPGAFHLSRALKRECVGSGSCVVSSANWEDAGKTRVRHPVWNNFWVTRVNPVANRCDKNIAVINNQKDWVAAWDFFQQERKTFLINGNKIEKQLLPAVDFSTELILIIHLRNSAERPGPDSLVVDENGDLTFEPPPLAKAWKSNFCSRLLATIYRSGIKTVEGKRLPPPGD